MDFNSWMEKEEKIKKDRLKQIYLDRLELREKIKKAGL